MRYDTIKYEKHERTKIECPIPHREMFGTTMHVEEGCTIWYTDALPGKLDQHQKGNSRSSRARAAAASVGAAAAATDDAEESTHYPSSSYHVIFADWFARSFRPVCHEIVNFPITSRASICPWSSACLMVWPPVCPPSSVPLLTVFSWNRFMLPVLSVRFNFKTYFLAYCFSPNKKLGSVENEFQ